MDTTVDIFNGMIHNLVGILPGKSLVGEQGIGVEGRASFNVLLDLRLKCGFLAVRDDRSANFTAALKDTHDSGFVLGSGTSDAANPLGQVHVASLAADECLIRFDLTREHSGGVVMHSHTDAMEHEPSGLLGDAECTSHLSRANSVLAIADDPESTHPLIESERGILEDRSNLEAELFLAARAKPDLASLDEGVLLRPAARAANYAVREAHIERVLESAISVREVDDCLLECVRGFHSSNLRPIALCVKYVIALLRQQKLYTSSDENTGISPLRRRKARLRSR